MVRSCSLFSHGRLSAKAFRYGVLVLAASLAYSYRSDQAWLPDLMASKDGRKVTGRSRSGHESVSTAACVWALSWVPVRLVASFRAVRYCW